MIIIIIAAADASRSQLVSELVLGALKRLKLNVATIKIRARSSHASISPFEGSSLNW